MTLRGPEPARLMGCGSLRSKSGQMDEKYLAGTLWICCG